MSRRDGPMDVVGELLLLSVVLALMAVLLLLRSPP